MRHAIATALLVGSALLTPATASATPTLFGLTLASTPPCTAFAATPTFNYTSCLGSFVGNDKNQNLSAALASFGAGAFTAQGASDDANAGPFTGNSSMNSGMLTFDTPQSGPFVLILKAGNQFSMYYFANATSTSSVTFDTEGTSLNRNEIANGLSHASLYSTNVVPEPSTYALMATGLIGLGAAARRVPTPASWQGVRFERRRAPPYTGGGASSFQHGWHQTIGSHTQIISGRRHPRRTVR